MEQRHHHNHQTILDGAFALLGADVVPTFRIYAGKLDDQNNFTAEAKLLNIQKRPSMPFYLRGYFDPKTGDVDLVLDVTRLSEGAKVGALFNSVRVGFDENVTDGIKPIWAITTIVVPQRFRGRLNLTFEESEENPGQEWARVWQGEISRTNPVPPQDDHFLLDGVTVELQLNELKC